MANQADQDLELQFVVSTNPLAKNDADRRRVRAQAAMQSWPQRRRREFERLTQHVPDAVNAGSVPALEPIRTRNNTSQTRARRRRKAEPPQALSPSDRERAVPPALLERATASSDDRILRAHAPRDELASDRSLRIAHQEAARHVLVPRRSTSGHSDGSGWEGDLAMISAPPTPDPQLLLGSAINPFAQYPIPWRPWFNELVHHMHAVYAPRGWPALGLTYEQGMEWERYTVSCSESHEENTADDGA